MAGRDADPFWWICLTDILMLAKVTECPRWFFIISTSYSRAPWGKNIEKIKSGKDMLQCCMLHESRVCCSKWLNFTNCFLSRKYETRALRCTFFMSLGQLEQNLWPLNKSDLSSSGQTSGSHCSGTGSAQDLKFTTETRFGWMNTYSKFENDWVKWGQIW